MHLKVVLLWAKIVQQVKELQVGMNPGEDHCYSEQVKNIEDSGSK